MRYNGQRVQCGRGDFLEGIKRQNNILVHIPLQPEPRVFNRKTSLVIVSSVFSNRQRGGFPGEAIVTTHHWRVRHMYINFKFYRNSRTHVRGGGLETRFLSSLGRFVHLAQRFIFTRFYHVTTVTTLFIIDFIHDERSHWPVIVYIITLNALWHSYRFTRRNLTLGNARIWIFSRSVWNGRRTDFLLKQCFFFAMFYLYVIFKLLNFLKW